MRHRTEDFLVGKALEKVPPLIGRLARFMIAFLGSLTLVVPIAKIHQSLLKSLMASSVAVVVFAALLSLVCRASKPDTLAAIAIYVAVVTVFVGKSTRVTSIYWPIDWRCMCH